MHTRPPVLSPSPPLPISPLHQCWEQCLVQCLWWEHTGQRSLVPLSSSGTGSPLGWRLCSLWLNCCPCPVLTLLSMLTSRGGLMPRVWMHIQLTLQDIQFAISVAFLSLELKISPCLVQNCLVITYDDNLIRFMISLGKNS